jgi:hypothetical protein
MTGNDHNGPNKAHIIDDAVNGLPDFLAIARDIQNRAKRRVGSGLTEAQLFCKFFGTSVIVVEHVWKLIVQGKHLPDNGHPEHLLWCLHFLKVYPKQGPGCAAIGGYDRDAVDPETHRKWVWAFIEAVEGITDVVVSIFLFCVVFFHRHSCYSR